MVLNNNESGQDLFKIELSGMIFISGGKIIAVKEKKRMNSTRSLFRSNLIITSYLNRKD
jgi:hypothetical protein